MPIKFTKIAAACTLALAAFGPALTWAQSADDHPGWPGAGQLFVGTNYQPSTAAAAPRSNTTSNACGRPA
jgi:hypothetical protein